MEAELKRLSSRGLARRDLPRPARPDEQTLLFPFDPDLAWLAVNHARTPSRVLWDLCECSAERLEPLYDELFDLAVSDRRWMSRGLRITVDPPDVADFPAGPLQVRGTVKNALIDASKTAGTPLILDGDDPDVVVSVRGPVGAMRVALDLAGGSMHARGYRLEQGEAPLRETLAAQMLILSRWDARHEALIDPLAGSGTLVLEAAQMATGAPLWVNGRRPAADRLPLFRGRAPGPETPLPELFPGTAPLILGNELDPGTCEALRRNLDRAGVGARVDTAQGDFRELDLSRLRRIFGKTRHGALALDRGLVVTNPPYGLRLETGGHDEALEKLYRDLGKWCARLGPGWRFAFLCADPALERVLESALDEQPVMKKPMSNGPIRGHFLLYGRGEAVSPAPRE